MLSALFFSLGWYLSQLNLILVLTDENVDLWVPKAQTIHHRAHSSIISPKGRLWNLGRVGTAQDVPTSGPTDQAALAPDRPMLSSN